MGLRIPSGEQTQLRDVSVPELRRTETWTKPFFLQVPHVRSTSGRYQSPILGWLDIKTGQNGF